MSAVGTDPITYQWAKGGVALDGQTKKSLKISDLKQSDADEYKVFVVNEAGRVESDPIKLTVSQPATIVSQPVGGDAILGQSATLSVVAAGSEPISFQWFFNDEPIDGKTERKISLDNLGAKNGGMYHVMVSNHAGVQKSDVIVLNVAAPPAILEQSESISVVEGDSIELKVSAVGSQPLAYQWSKGGVVLEGATDPSLILNNIQPSDGDAYRVAISNDAGRVESETMNVTVVQPATIVAQPVGGSFVAGEEVLLVVTAAGSEPISFQWYVDGEKIEGAKAGTLKIENVDAFVTGSYHVVVSNHASEAMSTPAAVSVNSPPVIAELSDSVSAIEGESVQLSVNAIGTAPLVYQWSKGGVQLDGENGSVLKLQNIAPSDADSYQVAVSNLAGRVESDVISVVVVQPAIIVSEPEGISTVPGELVSFSVVAAGTEPLSYQWFKNEQRLEGESESKLSFVDVSAIDVGEYRVLVSNGAGSQSSKTVRLSIESPPEIIKLPEDQIAPVGGQLVLNVTAVGNAPLTYQWKKDGVLLDGENGASLSLVNLQTPDSGTYVVIVSNSVGRVESAPMNISVAQPVSIISQPKSVEAVIGGKVIFEVAATGSAPITYQWNRDGVPLEGANFEKLIIENVEVASGGAYSVAVGNVSNSVESDTVILTVAAPPLVADLAVDQQVAVGETVQLWVVAEGAGSFAYQWKREGIVVPGATRAEFTIENIDSLDAGLYTVEITNSAGITASDPIMIDVVAAPEIVNHPESKQIGFGSRLILSVSATGSDLEFQWYHDGEQITGANDAVFTVLNAGSVDSGSYHVRVFNTVNSVKSDAANVVVVAPPQLLSQPKGGVAPIGGAFSFDVNARGAGDLEYQWRVDGVNIKGANHSALQLAGLELSDAGVYTVEVTNAAGITTSEEAELDVLMPVSVGTHPSDQSVVSGDSVLFDAVFVGSSPIEYQWFFNEIPIKGETSASMTIENVSVENLGHYHVVASNPVSTTFSDPAKLTVNLPPSISQHPVAKSAVKGESVQFTVQYAGTGPFELQWQRNGFDLEGAVNKELEVAQVDAADDAEYAVIVRNDYGVVVSDTVRLQVLLPVTITSQPKDAYVAVNAELNLSVTANGTGPFEYQWFKEGEIIEGATEAKLLLPSISRKGEGFYKVQIKNMLGAVISRSAEVVVNEPVNVVSQPKGGSIKEGGFARFWVSATGSEPLSYQWYLNGEPIEGKTRSSMIVNQATGADEGDYTVIVTNPVGFKISDEAVLDVNTAPRIEPIPAVVLAPGESMEIKVKAEDFDGENSKIKYSLQNAPDGMRILRNGLFKWTVGKSFESGTFNVVVTAQDEHGVKGSANARITVNRPPVINKIPEQSIKVGKVYEFVPDAIDPDDAILAYSMSDLPEGAEFSEKDGFRWVPLPNQTGVHELAVTVKDSHGVEDSQVVILIVESAPVEPIVTLYSSVDVEGGYSLVVDAQLDEEIKSLTVQRDGERRFYRVRSREREGGGVRITNIRLSGEDVVISYESLED